ncbi:MAG: hypothetical protein AAGB11_13835 [Pseudomonadota bacterium]
MCSRTPEAIRRHEVFKQIRLRAFKAVSALQELDIDFDIEFDIVIAGDDYRLTIRAVRTNDAGVDWLTSKDSTLRSIAERARDAAMADDGFHERARAEANIVWRPTPDFNSPYEGHWAEAA